MGFITADFFGESGPPPTLMFHHVSFWLTPLPPMFHHDSFWLPSTFDTPPKYGFWMQFQVHLEAIEYQAPSSGILIIFANKNGSSREKNQNVSRNYRLPF